MLAEAFLQGMHVKEGELCSNYGQAESFVHS